VPELIAKQKDLPYIKTPNEDFNSILKGALGFKKRIHIAVSPLKEKNYACLEEDGSENERIQAFAKALDNKIHTHYKLWPSNYIAFDKLHNTTKYDAFYDAIELRQFERRLHRRIDAENKIAIDSFLKMYATPVLNALQYE
jgi:ornithine carbamoyltransferase